MQCSCQSTVMGVSFDVFWKKVQLIGCNYFSFFSWTTSMSDSCRWAARAVFLQCSALSNLETVVSLSGLSLQQETFNLKLWEARMLLGNQSWEGSRLTGDGIVWQKGLSEDKSEVTDHFEQTTVLSCSPRLCDLDQCHFFPYPFQQACQKDSSASRGLHFFSYKQLYSNLCEGSLFDGFISLSVRGGSLWNPLFVLTVGVWSWSWFINGFSFGVYF